MFQNLQRNQELFESYDQVIQKQLAEGAVAKVNDKANCGQREFYLPHKAVARENSESTKLRIVYDASARENSKSLSLNDCLETDPALQSLLWSILIRTIALCGDLQKVFHQIRIKKEGRDALRFHWVRNKDPNQIEALRFTRLVFGLMQSSFILQRTICKHLSSYTEKYPAEFTEIREDLYNDDLITGGENFEQVASLKDIAIEIFREADFKLHKWHSNVLGEK